MSYVLFLGFKTKINKKFPLVRLWLDNIFLNEFNLTRSISGQYEDHAFPMGFRSPYLEQYTKVGEHQLSPETNLTLKWHDFVALHPQLNCIAIEIDENYIQSKSNHNLKIEVINTDNNYTNGFMTKTTLVQFCYAYLVPKSVVKDLLHYCEKNHTSEIRKRRIDKIQKNNHMSLLRKMMFEDFNFQKKSEKFKFDLKDLMKTNKDTDPTIRFFNTDTQKYENIKHMAFFTQGVFEAKFPTTHVTETSDGNEFFGDTKLETYNLCVICNKYHEYENY